MAKEQPIKEVPTEKPVVETVISEGTQPLDPAPVQAEPKEVIELPNGTVLTNY